MEITQKVGFSLCSFGFNRCHCHSGASEKKSVKSQQTVIK